MSATGFTKAENRWFQIKQTFALFAMLPCLIDMMAAFDAQSTITDRSIHGVSSLFLFTFLNWFSIQSLHFDQTKRWWREDAASKNAEIERLKREIAELTEPEEDDD